MRSCVVFFCIILFSSYTMAQCCGSCSNDPKQKKIIPGGYFKQDPQMKEMQITAKKTVKLLNKKSQDLKLVKILKAATQVVAGTNYFFRLKLSDKKEIVIADVFVYENFQRKLSITKYKVIKKQKISIIPGGYYKQDPKMKEMQIKAKETVKLLQKKHPNLKLVKVLKAATQIVAGTNYFFQLELKTGKKTVIMNVIVYEDFKGKMTITKVD